MSHFVILSSARCGTQYLETLLNSHSKITCYGEVLSQDSKHGYFLSKVLPPQLHSLIDSRLESPELLLNKAIYRSHDRSYGFRLFYEHICYHKDPAKIDRCLQSVPGIKIIHLERDNLFEQFLSFEIAKRDLLWRKTSESPESEDFERPITINAEDCLTFFERLQYKKNKCLRYFHGIPETKVSYEELQDQGPCAAQKLLEFLELDLMPLNSDLMKQRQKSAQEVVENYTELVKYFSGTEWSQYFF